MSATVKLNITSGPLNGKEYAFTARNTCLIGRDVDCGVRLPDDEAHRTISRHHCLLDINPPDIRIRDFGSMNGTFVNGEKIGQRPVGAAAKQGAALSFPERDLEGGDIVALGGTLFRVGISLPPRQEAPRPSPAVQAAAPVAAPAAALRVKCARCGKDVAAEIGQKREGAYVCAACRANPLDLIRLLLEKARQDEPQAAPIKGYVIERQLGAGGFGAVYLARHEATGKKVALKTMLPRVAADNKTAQMFLRETAVTKSLDHPNLVRLYDSGCCGGTFFFTMDFCDSGSVEDLVKKSGGRLPLETALPLILQTLDGLAYAHQAPLPQVKLADGKCRDARGIVHRDLKPGNIFLHAEAGGLQARIGDYGLGKAFDLAGLSGQTCTGQMAGTPGFMPRQQLIDFLHAGPEVDIWAAAASLYYMLTGTVPRDFTSGKDPMRIILNEVAVPIRKRNPQIPRALAEAIDLALVDKGRPAYASAKAFKQALELAR